MDLSTATPQIFVVIERLPEVVDGLAPRLSTSVDEDTDLGLFGSAYVISSDAAAREQQRAPLTSYQSR